MATAEPDPSALNRATASVLLLYHHLLSEGGVTNEQTVYVDPVWFEPAQYLNVHIGEADAVDVDEALLREGALLHLLCDLNDLIAEYEEDYLAQPSTSGILALIAQCAWLPDDVGRLISTVEKPLVSEADFSSYREQLRGVYGRLVVDRFRRLIPDGA